MQLGTASAEPDEYATGTLDVAELPTGNTERLPVQLYNGPEDGPTLWVTAAIHGDETTGLAVAHDFMEWVQGEPLHGSIVCLPNLNPAGLRQNVRTSYYHDDDPNRYFARDGTTQDNPPRVQQCIDETVFEHVVDGADALVALHTSWIATFSYNIRPRVSYGDVRTEQEANDLSERIATLTDAFGLPVVNQFPPDATDRRSLQHTLVGAAVDAGIPAFTPELGGRLVVEAGPRQAAVDGLRNLLVELDMHPSLTATSPRIRAPIDEPVRRCVHPYADTAGVVRYRVTEGETIEEGDAVADIVATDGTQKSTVRTERSGYVLSRREGAAVYRNDPLLDLAVLDDDPLVVPNGVNS